MAWGNVGFLLYPGFEVLDVFGPMEMVGLLVDLGHAARLLTVAQAAGPVTSSQGPEVVAQHGFEDCPPLDALFVPGGLGARREVGNEPLLAWLRAQHRGEGQGGEGGTGARGLKHLVSVCTGAALLARAGLLDGRRATSNKSVFDWVASTSASVDWVRPARWVVDGRVRSSAGVSAGMDATLRLICDEFGEGVAAEVARRAEYTGDYWDAGNDPFGVGEQPPPGAKEGGAPEVHS